MQRLRSHLSRLSLKKTDAAVKPLLATLLPPEQDKAMAVQHRLLWSLFPDAGSQTDAASAASPFLWRQVGSDGRFFVLGPPPVPASPWFEVESRPFDVRFRTGQRLGFDLRVHATVDRMLDPAKGRSGRRRVDLVLDALHRTEKAAGTPFDRAAERDRIANDALRLWLAAQGERAGFRLVTSALVAHHLVPPPGKSRKTTKVGIADLAGVIEVTDPDLFADRHAIGFGRMKAFGCGLMLLRPAD